MKISAIAAACAAMMMSSVASADLVLNVTGTSGGNPNALAVGESVTLEITMRNPNATEIFGLGLSVHDYNEAVVSFGSGTSVDDFLYAVVIPGAGCFNGLANASAGALAESSIGANGNRVTFASGVSTTAFAATAVEDCGLDGAPGTTQFELTFTGVAAGTTTLLIDSAYEGDAVILAGGANAAAVGDTLTITVPEPGAVAAGVAALGSVLGLAGIRRRI